MDIGEGNLILEAVTSTVLLSRAYADPPSLVTTDQVIAIKALWTHCSTRLAEEGIVTTECF